ncbi:Aldehyde/histidinol dehydrogenase [Dipodascopsis uninucleata]
MNIVQKLKDPNLFKTKAFVNGKWVGAKSGETFEVIDPSTDSPIGECPEFNTADVEEAIQSASKAFEKFRRTSGRERSKMLRKWYDLTMAHQEDLATLITMENGKIYAEAKGEIAYAASFLEWFSEEAPRIYGDVIQPSVGANRAITLKQPIGVCAMITPWNFPAAMITRKAAAAVAAGCTIVVKPDHETPYTALALAELAKQAGIPDGVINIVTTKKNIQAVGTLLCESPKVKKLSFTGSTEIGKLLMMQSASTLKKLSFELGGNAPFIVFDDVDVAKAVEEAIKSKFRGTGQTCVCANRIFVQKGVYDEFCKKMASTVSAFKIGSGFDKETTHGPLIHDRAIKKVKSHVEDAISHGGVVLVGGKTAPELGPYFYKPTVIAGANGSMKIASEETFGPVAAIFPFETEEEVIELANGVEVGLGSYLMTHDVNRIWRVSEGLEFGMIGVNTGVFSDASTPFGGVKFSGFGREGSKYGLEDYLTVKSVTFGSVGQPN